MALAVAHTTWKPMSQVQRVDELERMRRKARLNARVLNHTLGEWQDDTPVSSVTQCLVCEEYAAVDNGNGREYCGKALTAPCNGPAIY